MKKYKLGESFYNNYKKRMIYFQSILSMIFAVGLIFLVKDIENNETDLTGMIIGLLFVFIIFIIISVAVLYSTLKRYKRFWNSYMLELGGDYIKKTQEFMTEITISKDFIKTIEAARLKASSVFCWVY